MQNYDIICVFKCFFRKTVETCNKAVMHIMHEINGGTEG